MSKTLSIILLILGIIALCSIYPIYFIIIYNTSKSPDDFSNFPTEGTWVCTTNNFSITIEILNDIDNNTDSMNVTITYDNQVQQLESYITHGHGTPLAPVAPQTILVLQSKNIEDDNDNCISISCSKYKFNENDFTLIDIDTRISNKLDIFNNINDLKFIKQ